MRTIMTNKLRMLDIQVDEYGQRMYDSLLSIAGRGAIVDLEKALNLFGDEVYEFLRIYAPDIDFEGWQKKNGREPVLIERK